MSTSDSKIFKVGITSDVLMSNGEPIFGREVFDLLNQPGLHWEFMDAHPEIEDRLFKRPFPSPQHPEYGRTGTAHSARRA